MGRGRSANRLSSGRVALVFGTEKFGLSTKDLSHCHWLMRIPTRDEHISMNLGQAVAVCLYELSRDARAVQQPVKGKSATAGEVERISAVMLEALRDSGYVKPRTEASTEEKVRRLVRRLSLQAGDAEVWLGMLRQMLWKIRDGGEQR